MSAPDDQMPSTSGFERYSVSQTFFLPCRTASCPLFGDDLNVRAFQRLHQTVVTVDVLGCPPARAGTQILPSLPT